MRILKGAWPLALLFVALLGLMDVKNLLELPPPLRVADAPDQFNAARAKARLAFILGDQQPHPSDVKADDLVRSRLVLELRRMGLTPIVRDQFACNALFKQRGVSCARVRNVIALLGPSSGKALLLNAHYDSVPVGPGASDDGAGVATLLEVASILTHRPLGRPVILLFNEGEELGLVGARAFLADPLSEKVDSLVNLEARGVRGPVNMFETSRPNAAPIRIFAAAVKSPVANSLSTDLYRLIPNYTDVNSFRVRGWLTLNFAPIGNETRYHSPGDNIAALDPAMLQHMGDQTLAVAQELAVAAPEARNGTLIFMDLGARMLIRLPFAAGAVVLGALFLVFLVLSVENGGLPAGLTIAAGTFVGSGLIAALALKALGAARHPMFWRAQPIWTHLATYACAIFVGSLLIGAIGREANLRQLRTTFWLFITALAGTVILFAPGGIIFFIFPPLLAALGMLLARWWKPAEVIGALAAILFLYLTWGGLLGLLEELLDNGPMWVFALLGSLLIAPVLIEAKPLLLRVRVREAAIIAGVLPFLAWGAAAAAPPYSADREERFVIEHVTDADHAKSWWSLLNDGAPLPSAFGSGWKRGTLPFSDQLRWLAKAPSEANASAPDLKLVSSVENGDERTLQVQLISNGSEAISLVAPPDARIRSAGSGTFVEPIDEEESGRFSVSCFGRSCDNRILILTIGRREAVPFIVLGAKALLPPSAAPLLAARPKWAQPQYRADESIVFKVRRL